MAGPRLYLPNLGHPINVGKVAWLLSLPGGTMSDLLSGALALPRGPTALSGARRNGALGAAFQTNATTAAWVLGAGAIPTLPGLATPGFTVAFWLNPLGGALTSRTFLDNSAGVATTGWRVQASGTSPALRVNRATTPDTCTATSTSLIAAQTWVRVMFAAKLGGPYACFANGLPQAVSSTTGSGVNGDDTTISLVVGNAAALTSSAGWALDDICLWSRRLGAQEAWADFVESSAGYPGALLSWPLKVRSSVAAAGGALVRRLGRKAWKREPVFDYWRRGAP